MLVLDCGKGFELSIFVGLTFNTFICIIVVLLCMSTVGYHVTTEQNVESLKSEGLKPKNKHPSHRTRKEMREQFDLVMNDRVDNWVDREGAVFFWSSFEDARRYAENNFDTRRENVYVVSFDLSSKDCFSAYNPFIEDVFRDWPVNLESLDIEDYVEPWSGNETAEYEIWCQDSLSASSITNIVQI